ESITTIGSMDSGLALRAPRNDDVKSSQGAAHPSRRRFAAPQDEITGVWRRHSHHLALSQLRDLIAAKTKFREHLFGLLAELRRARRHRAWRARQGHGLADQLNVPVLVIGHMLRDAEMFDLRILEHLVDGINRTAGHAGVVQFLDPGLRGFLL